MWIEPIALVAKPATLQIMPLSASSALGTTANISPTGYRQYGDDVWALYNRAVAECNALLSHRSAEDLAAANTQLKTDITALCGTFSLSVPNWRVNYEKNDNEISIDFN